MKKILIVEDDAVVASIYRNKLQNEGYEVDIAVESRSAIAKLKSAPPHLVVLDLGLPGINGVETLKLIRANPPTAATPVVVLSNSYITSLVQAAWKAGANKCLSKSECSPRLLVDVIHGIFAAAPAVAESAPATPSSPTQVISSDALFQSQVRIALLNNAPEFLEDLRKRLKIFAQQNRGSDLPEDLFDFYRAVHSLTGHAGSAGFTSIANFCAALEAFLKELHDTPKRMGPSPLRTIAQAIDVLASLFARTRQPQTEEQPPPLILALDDDIIARRAVCSALDKARLRSISLSDPGLALALLEENTCDLIFSDVEMPAMNGFEFCEKLRALSKHKQTPLVFVTNVADFENRARSTLSGGTDLIAKPFLLVELAVKALTYVLRTPSK